MTSVGTKSPGILDRWWHSHAARTAGIPMYPSGLVQHVGAGTVPAGILMHPVNPADIALGARAAEFRPVTAEAYRDFAMFGTERTSVARSTWEV